MLKFVTERYVNNLMLKEQLCFKGCISFTVFFNSKEKIFLPHLIIWYTHSYLNFF